MTSDDHVEQEITDHPIWCSPNCETFLSDEYRQMRARYSAATVQGDYDLCHIWR